MTKPTSVPDEAAVEQATAGDTSPVLLHRILVALDASDHANRALSEATRLVGTAGGVITGIHAYAAKLHDNRFRQMEGGLPERYRKETEMERQREVHDDLITRGLAIISDSYHDSATAVCEDAGVPYRHLSPEGKNYRRIVEAAASGDFDLLALGALGLGAVPGSAVGTVCERVVRRCPIDALVIRDAGRAIGDGPLVVGLDGSPRSFGALKTALWLSRRLGGEVHAVASYDPYFHYVAFNKISGVLSEEAGRQFRFKEQEKLHEKIIDSGIAKIYQSHLELARSVAAEDGTEIVCELLDGKPYQAIGRYLGKVDASLLLVGKTGVHADPELDIGGNAENLLRMAPCHIWFGQTTHAPSLDAVARETIAWTEEAEARMERVPETARNMVRIAILRFAQESGHTVITSALIEEATRRFCPERGGSVESEDGPVWSDEATRLLAKAGDPAVSTSIRLRAEKRARRAAAPTVTPDHVRPFLDEGPAPAPVWGAAALARLSRVPEMVRGSVRRRIEASARERGIAEITLELAEAGLAQSKQAMEEAMQGGGAHSAAKGTDANGEQRSSACPFAELHGSGDGDADRESSESARVAWTPEAERRLERVPGGFLRTMTRQRVEVFAQRCNVTTITPAVVEEKYAEWAAGAAKRSMTLKWEDTARGRIDRIPGFVRGMVILEVERCARDMGKDTVTGEVIDRATDIWERSGTFHSDANPQLYT
ncbi:MAG: universal stress protein [Alphaproteobacteria bacterium]